MFTTHIYSDIFASKYEQMQHPHLRAANKHCYLTALKWANDEGKGDHLHFAIIDDKMNLVTLKSFTYDKNYDETAHHIDQWAFSHVDKDDFNAVART